MNYQSIYATLIIKAKAREISEYTEQHHIIPKCLNGSDSIDNLVKLTAREHFIAHKLLCKLYPENANLLCALHMLTISSKHVRRNNKLFGKLQIKVKQAISKVASASQVGKNNSQFGTKWIHNPDTASISKIQIDAETPEGWDLGRIPKSRLYSERHKVVKKTISYNNAILKTLEREQLARKLYNIFISENFASVREFSRSSYYDKSHVSLTKLWKQYIPEFSPKQGKAFRE